MKKLLILYILTFCNTQAIFFVPFDVAMQPNTSFHMGLISQPHWYMVKYLYDTYAVSSMTKEKLRIPKIIHHIWIGSDLPAQYQKFRETWMVMHPGWEFVLWNESAIQNLGLKNKAIYEASRNFGAKSDIARYEILYRFGGLYVDTDFECLRSFEFLHYCVDFYSGIGFESTPDLYNGLIGACPGHPILKECIDTLSQIPSDPRNSMDIMKKTGPFHFSACFFRLISQLINTPTLILPPGYIYPWPHYIKNEPNPYKWVRSETIALHHWNVSWMKGV